MCAILLSPGDDRYVTVLNQRFSCVMENRFGPLSPGDPILSFTAQTPMDGLVQSLERSQRLRSLALWAMEWSLLTCRRCQQPLERRHRHGLLEGYVLNLLGFYPWHCSGCQITYYRRAREPVRMRRNRVDPKSSHRRPPLAATPEAPERFLCRLQLAPESIVYTCGRCGWTYRVKGEDSNTAESAFSGHRCEDFPAKAMPSLDGNPETVI
jgi:hypothetical protein